MNPVLPVSICLTTYNRAAVLPKTIDSLLRQTFGDWELIISDDCSTDNTEEVCKYYEARDPRVRYFRNPKNLKMPGNLNAAIRRARGEYVANVHDGDVYRVDLIEKWKAALDEVATASYVFNDYECIDANGNRKIWNMSSQVRIDGKEIALYFFKTFTSCVYGTVMARRKAYEKYGPFNHRYGFISDVDMWLRMARDDDVAYVNEPLIFLTPRESHHPYAFVHWRLTFWNLGIYLEYLSYYKDKLPLEVQRFSRDYPRRRRNMLLFDLACCIKHHRWDRMKEGFAIWRDADDPMLRGLGTLIGRDKNKPDWYNCSYWEMASSKK